VSELRGQVERGDAVMRLLGDSSPAGSSAPTDVGALLRQLAELLRADVSEKISLELLTTEACFVQMARPSLLCIVCGAIEIALDNIRATAGDGHLQLRASKSDTEALIEVTDDGVPGATDLRASIVDSLLADPRTARLRQLRERVRAVDGELAVDADEGGSVVSIYLPLSPEVVAQEPVARVPSLHLERRNH